MKLEDLNLNMHFFDPNATLVHGAVSTAVVHRNCTTGWQSILGRFLACIARPYHTIPYHTPDMAMQHVLTLQETPKVQRTVDCITAAQPSIS